ncbi:MAG: LEA type 2 family protein [Planctomycetota bacterium]|nr:LEA type 2 family protein [Planctomycetota bacterium]
MKTAHRKRDSSAVGLVFVGVLAGVLLLGGCSRRATPSAVVTDASIRDRTAEAAVIEFAIETTNPNDIELPMRDVVYTLSIEGERVFSGRRDAQATMPRGGTQEITLPAVVPMGEGGVMPGVYRYTLKGRVFYSLPSQLADVLFDAKLSRPSVMIADEGEIDLR